MKIRQLIAIAMFAAATPSCGLAAQLTTQPVVAGSVQPSAAEVDRGRYLVRVAGCHDCHTPGYAQSGGQVHQDVLLTGDATGFEGPWGISFASNLRLTMLRFNDEQWLRHVRTLTTRPPMPWFNLRTMNDEDLVSILRYVQWLGPKGEPAPQGLPPGDGYIGPMVRYTTHEQ